MKVGKKYFILRKDYDKFKDHCRRVSISPTFAISFKNEKANVLKYRDSIGRILLFENVYGLWRFSKDTIPLFMEYKEFTQEEMEL